MKVQLEIGNRLRTVEVRRDEGGYLVSVDGRPKRIAAAEVAPGTWSLIIDDDGITARSIEAVVRPDVGNGGGLHVHLDGHAIAVRLQQGLGRRSRNLVGSSGAGPQRVVAPMPGKVVRVLVAPGDEVQPRQGLVVVEAMKMENELRAARAGRVRDVFVTEGQSVDAGSPLVVVE